MRCTQSFAKLVARHTAWICAVARRRVKDQHLAEDVTQAVFLILSRKAGRIGPDTPLSAWLFRVTRFAANDALKREARRRKRFEIAATFYSEEDEAGGSDPDIDVDSCIACLGEVDRHVILLRFYEEKSMAQLAQTMGITEHAAKKRVARALNRLRRIFARRGIRVGSLLSLTGLIKLPATADAASIHSLSSQITQLAAGASGPSAPIAALANATLRSLATTHARILAAMAGASVVLCLAVSTLSPVMGQAILPFIERVKSVFVGGGVITDVPSSHSLAASGTAAQAGSSESAVKQVWAGRAGGFAWPLLPGNSGSISLQSVVNSSQPVAVIEDHRGQLWYRKVDSELIPPSPDLDETRSYEQLNPYANSPSYQQALLNQVARDLTLAETNASVEETWKPLDKFRMIDGADPLQQDMQSIYAEQTTIPENFAPINVPEPALAGLGVGLCLLTLRRRRA